MNSRFIIPKIQKLCFEKNILNDILSSRFSILKTNFTYETLILETLLLTESLFRNYPKL